MAGGCELRFYIPGIEDFLAIGSEIAIYTTPEDCLQQVKRLLGDPEEQHRQSDAIAEDVTGK